MRPRRQGLALLCGPSTSPLDAMISSVPQRRPRSCTGACAECNRLLLVSCLLLALGGPSHANEPVYVQLLDKNATVVHTLTDSEYVELQKSLDVFSSSAGLGAIHDGDKEEIRVWMSVATFDPTTEGVETVGLVAANNSVLVCRVRGPVASKGHAGQRRYCKVNSKGNYEEVHAMIGDLANLRARDISCGVLDGYWVDIDGVYDGRRFSFSASNPDYCSDNSSKLVVRLLSYLKQ